MTINLKYRGEFGTASVRLRHGRYYRVRLYPRRGTNLAPLVPCWSRNLSYRTSDLWRAAYAAASFALRGAESFHEAFKNRG